MIKQLLATFFISLNAAVGIRKSHGAEELDKAHKFMFSSKGKKNNKKKFY